MRQLLIGLGILAVALTVQVQPSAAEPERAIVGDDDLPNGAPMRSTAAQVKRVCIQGPMHTAPQCRYDTIAQCRADCRRARTHRTEMGAFPGGATGRINCFLNPALQRQRAHAPSLMVRLAARESQAPAALCRL